MRTVLSPYRTPTRRTLLGQLLLTPAVAGLVARAQPQQQPAEEHRALDVPYVPTPMEVVEAMLKLGGVKKSDTLYDLGCGDGRIVVRAAKEFGARGVGIDIDPDRIREANENASKEHVEELVEFRRQDLFEADIQAATVVTLYLLPSVNLKLRPKLWRDLKVGTRVVSHSFDMGDWPPEKTFELDWRKLYLWTIREENKKQAG